MCTLPHIFLFLVCRKVLTNMIIELMKEWINALIHFFFWGFIEWETTVYFCPLFVHFRSLLDTLTFRALCNGHWPIWAPTWPIWPIWPTWLIWPIWAPKWTIWPAWGMKLLQLPALLPRPIIIPERQHILLICCFVAHRNKEENNRSSTLPPSEIECGALFPRPIIIPGHHLDLLLWSSWGGNKRMGWEEEKIRCSTLPPSEIECGALFPRPIIIPAKQHTLFICCDGAL